MDSLLWNKLPDKIADLRSIAAFALILISVPFSNDSHFA